MKTFIVTRTIDFPEDEATFSTNWRNERLLKSPPAGNETKVSKVNGFEEKFEPKNFGINGRFSRKLLFAKPPNRCGAMIHTKL